MSHTKSNEHEFLKKYNPCQAIFPPSKPFSLHMEHSSVLNTGPIDVQQSSLIPQVGILEVDPLAFVDSLLAAVVSKIGDHLFYQSQEPVSLGIAVSLDYLWAH